YWRIAGFLLDQLTQIVLIAIAQLLRIEFAGAAGDNRLGNLDHLTPDVVVGALAGFGGGELLLRPQRRHHPTRPVRFDQRRALLFTDLDVAERYPAAAAHSQSQRVDSVGSQLALGTEVIGRIDIKVIDLIARDELLEINDVANAATQLCQLVFSDR